MVAMTCPICLTEEATNPAPDMGMYHCQRCGHVQLTAHIAGWLATMRSSGQYGPAKADAVSHAVRQLGGLSGRCVFIGPEEIQTLTRDARINPPAVQADKLILWLGAELIEDPSGEAVCRATVLASTIGSRSHFDALDYILLYAAEVEGWISPSYVQASAGDAVVKAEMTVAGWQRYEQLQRLKGDSRLAFMAMQFNESSVQHAFESCFKPAASDAGFDLRLVTDGQGAGLIDDHLRVAIRTARFLVADLTTGNRGAYWEAGFAEGLGRPVIYTCREDRWADPDYEHRPHFDTNHLNTIIWSPDTLGEARQRLADTIRNTFPDEAAPG